MNENTGSTSLGNTQQRCHCTSYSSILQQGLKIDSLNLEFDILSSCYRVTLCDIPMTERRMTAWFSQLRDGRSVFVLSRHIIWLTYDREEKDGAVLGNAHDHGLVSDIHKRHVHANRAEDVAETGDDKDGVLEE